MAAKYSSVTEPAAHENNGETASQRWHFVFWQLETDKRAIIFVAPPPDPTHVNGNKLFHAALRKTKRSFCHTLGESSEDTEAGRSLKFHQSAVFIW